MEASPGCEEVGNSGPATLLRRNKRLIHKFYDYISDVSKSQEHDNGSQ